MTVYSPPIDRFPFWAVDHEMETGFSSEAKQLQRNVAESLEHYLKPRLEQLVAPILDVFSASQSEEVPVTMDTVTAAVRFAHLLPRTVQTPEVSSDPDGEVAFDWSAPSGKMFSVSIDRSGRLAYAGWYGETSRIHGTERLAGEIPEEILRGIQKASR